MTKPEVRPEKLYNEVVISGLAGRYPESNNLYELRDNLFNKVDLITDDDRRWKVDDPAVLQRTGKVHNIEKFDALFFGVHSKQAEAMDPMGRMLLEHAYEAIVDAGVNPKQIRGSNVGVFVGISFLESEKTWFYEKSKVNGFGVIGCSRAMLANRISYWLGVTGPSYAIDSHCSSSLSAMEHAYRAIRDGLCDAAIVGTSNLCLNPLISLQFYKLGALSDDGLCKTFDESANGFVRSEAIVVVFLQRAKDAKRIYATVVNGRSNSDGFKEQGITYPSREMQSQLLKEIYAESGLSPSNVSYVEAHGTGTKVGDLEEVHSIDKVLGVEHSKESPLLIGSVKTNLGHAEAASGLVSLSKIILAMETGLIPPNRNFKNCRRELTGIVEGRIKVITDPYPWKGGYAGISSFGLGGTNSHLILKSNPKDKVNKGAPNDDLPRLVIVSGRTKEAVSYVLDDVEKKSVDVEYVRLLHDIHSDDINGHMYRGYTILPAHGVAGTPKREIQLTSGVKRQIWFVFSGMGSQWPGMGEALLQLPIFAASIKKCDATLKPHGLDIYKILTNKDEQFDNILLSFVGIAALQIGLVDLLRALNIEPDYIIGHSLGELGCAYADGCFTAEQMILSAYSRGMASIETKVIHGSMAAVGMCYKDLIKLCPNDIEVACHNSSESATISGPADSMKNFIAELQAKKIFAREVPCSNIPYHSRYIAPAGPKLLAYLKKVIPEPKARSEKWISTSVPMDEWDTPNARFSSAEYHTNNFLSPVLFEESSVLIPKDAITIEIAPHGLLQVILKRSLPSRVSKISLSQRCHKDNVEVFLQALGKMYNLGLQPQLANIYPHVQYPVSRSTPMMSPLIKWDHSDDWYVTSFKSGEKLTFGERQIKISFIESDYESLAGHVIDGRYLFPAIGYLKLIWETMGVIHGKFYLEMSVVFEDVRFLRTTIIPKDGEIEFTVTVQKGTGRFEIVEGGAAIVTGMVRICSNPAAEKMKLKILEDNEEESMTSHDVYKEFRLRNYYYTGVFRSITRATRTGKRGHIAWYNDWVGFMDSMLQMKIFSFDTRELVIPTAIKKLVIDTNNHLGQIKCRGTDEEFEVHYNKLHDVIVSGGVEIRGLKTRTIAKRKPAVNSVLEEYKFIPFIDGADMSIREILRLITHIAIENQTAVKFKTIELLEETDKVSFENLLSFWICEALKDVPLIQSEIVIFGSQNNCVNISFPENVSIIDPKKANKDANALLVIGHKLLNIDNAESLNFLLAEMKPGGFLLSRETGGNIEDFEKMAEYIGYHLLMFKKSGNEMFFLLRKRIELTEDIVVINVTNDSFDWVDDMLQTMSYKLEKKSADNTRIIFVGQGDFDNGLMGLINCLKLELGGETVRGILIQDPTAPEFSLQNPFYAKQIEKDLTLSVLRKNGIWGSYRYLLLPHVEKKPVHHAVLHQKVRDDLSSFMWLEGPIQPNNEDENIVKIYYSSMNFKDVMIATGKLAIDTNIDDRLNHEYVIGFEYSGIDAKGKRIMGLIKNRAMANLCAIDPDLAWNVPDKWTLEDAATVPCVYGTCYYGLYLKGKIKKGQTILIHAGTGGIGQAAINLALNEGCEVFTTVGTPEKRQFIRENFPQIKDDHIGCTRDTSFEQMIMEMTNGRGVDIVLNSLTEEKLLASVNCVAWGGHFLEIGKFDLSSNNLLGMECFLREISFHGVMLDHLMCDVKENKLELWNLMNAGLKNGVIKPLIRTVFLTDQVEAAFRYMAAGKHMGKVLIKVRDEKEQTNNIMLAEPRFNCLENRSYIILEGLGGIGLELADLMVIRGARNLIITSRTGIKNGYQKMRIELWKSYGVNVVIVIGKDASSYDDCQFIIESATKLAPVDGIFNLVVVLRDVLWQNLTQQSFENSFREKAWSTKNLDVLSRKLCPKMRYFVVSSSIFCGRGNIGQSAYAMSNSVMERICERRVADGLPGFAFQMSVVSDVGAIVNIHEDSNESSIAGVLPQRISSYLEELDSLLHLNRPIVSSMTVAEKTRAGEFANRDDSLNLIDHILRKMDIKDLDGISPTLSLAELGMDSMMLVDVKEMLEREFSIFLTAQAIRSLNFNKLQEMNETIVTEESKK